MPLCQNETDTKNFKQRNPFSQPIFPLYTLKLWFSSVFRGYKMGTLLRNRSRKKIMLSRKRASNWYESFVVEEKKAAVSIKQKEKKLKSCFKK